MSYYEFPFLNNCLNSIVRFPFLSGLNKVFGVVSPPPSLIDFPFPEALFKASKNFYEEFFYAICFFNGFSFENFSSTSSNSV